jgi:hypothetical protein
LGSRRAPCDGYLAETGNVCDLKFVLLREQFRTCRSVKGE